MTLPAPAKKRDILSNHGLIGTKCPTAAGPANPTVNPKKGPKMKLRPDTDQKVTTLSAASVASASSTSVPMDTPGISGNSAIPRAIAQVRQERICTP